MLRTIQIHVTITKGGGSGRFDATQTCAALPNVNEMTWYAAKGDPRLGWRQIVGYYGSFI